MFHTCESATTNMSFTPERAREFLANKILANLKETFYDGRNHDTIRHEAAKLCDELTKFFKGEEKKENVV